MALGARFLAHGAPSGLAVSFTRAPKVNLWAKTIAKEKTPPWGKQEPDLSGECLRRTSGVKPMGTIETEHESDLSGEYFKNWSRRGAHA